MEVGDLIKLKRSGLIGYVIAEIANKKWRDRSARVLIFKIGERWIKIDQIEPLDKEIKT